MIVMDTCAIIWDALQKDALSATALRAINEADLQNRLLVSDISLWEIAMLIKKGRLKLDVTAAQFINLYFKSRNVTLVSISAEIAEQSVEFPDVINHDPADRIIAATVVVHRAHLVTADRNLLSAGVIKTIW